VEDEVRDLRASEILAVEDIEYVDGRFGDDATDVELLREAQVERRILIVFAAQVALGDRAVRIDAIGRRRRDGHEARIAEGVDAAERRADDARQRLRLRGAVRVA